MAHPPLTWDQTREPAPWSVLDVRFSLTLLLACLVPDLPGVFLGGSLIGGPAAAGTGWMDWPPNWATSFIQ